MIGNIKGLTLLEVLIALAIISIAITASIKAISENIQSTGYLKEKTAALFLAKDIINEVRLKQLVLPFEPGSMQDQRKFLNIPLDFVAYQVRTPNTDINEIIVKVYVHPKNLERDPIIQLNGFNYAL